MVLEIYLYVVAFNFNALDLPSLFAPHLKRAATSPLGRATSHRHKPRVVKPFPSLQVCFDRIGRHAGPPGQFSSADRAGSRGGARDPAAGLVQPVLVAVARPALVAPPAGTPPDHLADGAAAGRRAANGAAYWGETDHHPPDAPQDRAKPDPALGANAWSGRNIPTRRRTEPAGPRRPRRGTSAPRRYSCTRDRPPHTVRGAPAWGIPGAGSHSRNRVRPAEHSSRPTVAERMPARLRDASLTLSFRCVFEAAASPG